MKNEMANSRRNFLSTLAILSSGTLLAGSPAGLLDTGSAGNASLKTNWARLLKTHDAAGFLNISGSALPNTPEAIKGQVNKPGETVSFDKQQLLAQPTWIYWGTKSNHPDDVVISFFDTAYPYKKIKSINRFELQALVQLPAGNNLLEAICSKAANKNSQRLVVKTRIGKRKNVQEVNLFGNDQNILLKEQFIYNV